jgi:hypothetical protein
MERRNEIFETLLHHVPATATARSLHTLLNSCKVPRSDYVLPHCLKWTILSKLDVNCLEYMSSTRDEWAEPNQEINLPNPDVHISLRGGREWNVRMLELEYHGLR